MAARNQGLGCLGEPRRFVSLLVGDLAGFSKTMGISSLEEAGSLRGCRGHAEGWTGVMLVSMEKKEK